MLGTQVGGPPKYGARDKGHVSWGQGLGPGTGDIPWEHRMGTWAGTKTGGQGLRTWAGGRNSLESQTGNVVLGTQGGDIGLVTQTGGPTGDVGLGQGLGTETGRDPDRGRGPRLGGQDLVMWSRGLRLGDPGVGARWGHGWGHSLGTLAGSPPPGAGWRAPGPAFWGKRTPAPPPVPIQGIPGIPRPEGVKAPVPPPLLLPRLWGKPENQAGKALGTRLAAPPGPARVLRPVRPVLPGLPEPPCPERGLRPRPAQPSPGSSSFLQPSSSS